MLTCKNLLLHLGILLSGDLEYPIRISTVMSQSAFSTGCDQVIYPTVLDLLQWKRLRAGRERDCPCRDGMKSCWP